MNSRDPSGDELIGRMDHVAAIEAARDAVAGGGARAVFLTGPEGGGKTETLDFAAERLARAGAAVLRGRCLDLDEVSWCPLRVALKRLLAEPARSGIDVVNDLVNILEEDASEAGLLFHRVSEGLSKIAAGRPLVLMFDDLQWADTATLRYLPYLLAGLGPDRVLLVAGVRLPGLPGGSRVAKLVADLRRQPSVAVRELKPLTRAETAGLAEQIIGAWSPAERAERLWRRSGGHPFLVRALAVAERDGVDGLPADLRDVALSHVEALSEDARLVVRAVAVGGAPTSHRLLAAVTGLPDGRLSAAIAEAVRERILDEGRHIRAGLYAEVIEAGLDPAERVRFNERFAEELSASASPAVQGRLARHWLAARRPGEAWRCAAAAAGRAQGLHRHDEAHAFLSMAASIVEEIDDPAVPAEERRRMWRDAAEAAHRSGDHEAEQDIQDRLAATLSKPLPSWWHVLRARALTRADRPLDALAEYENAKRGSQECTDEDRAKATAHLADLLVQLGRYQEARRAAEAALAVVGDRPDCVKTRVLAESALGISQAYLNDAAAGRATLDTALRAAERHGEPADILRVRQRQAELLIGPVNELAGGIEAAAAGVELAERTGLGRTQGARLSAVVANGLFRAGRWADAAVAVEAGLDRAPSGAVAVELLLARAKVGLALGDLDRAGRDLDAVEALTAGGGSVRHVLPLFTLRAGLALWRGAPDVAADAVAAGLSRWVRQTEDLEMRAVLVWHGFRAAAEKAARSGPAAVAGDARVARLRAEAHGLERERADAADAVRESVDSYLVLCAAELTRVAGRPGVAEWERAAQVWERRRHPYPAAYSLLRLAEARYLAGSVRDTAARDALREAHRKAVALGARPLAAEIVEFGQRVRVTFDLERPKTAPKKAGGTSGALTPQELKVLGLAAEALTNKQIAERLFLSPKTVGVHLSNVYRKLKVRGRLEACTWYREGRR